MSDCKYLILDGIVIKKIEEIRKDLTVEIQEEKHKEELDKEIEWGKSYPYEVLLEEIEELLIKYQRSYVSTSYGMDLPDVELTLRDYIKEQYPDWEHIYDETDYQERERRLEEIKKDCENRVTN